MKRYGTKEQTDFTRAWQSSGESIGAFCRQNQISVYCHIFDHCLRLATKYFNLSASLRLSKKRVLFIESD